MMGWVMLLWDPEDSASETHLMGLTVTTMWGKAAPVHFNTKDRMAICGPNLQ